ncbi:hypothetical protein [Nonomuraea sp. NPDC049480]|uniref:hypothetical protein n=1 Tax=Nonomuraea sp. NPDC049480 TaxID=3364353 RepID=UPI0037B627BD
MHLTITVITRPARTLGVEPFFAHVLSGLQSRRGPAADQRVGRRLRGDDARTGVSGLARPPAGRPRRHPGYQHTRRRHQAITDARETPGIEVVSVATDYSDAQGASATRGLLAAALPDITYRALGHIRKSQAIGGAGITARYAGSPLQLDFDEEGETKRQLRAQRGTRLITPESDARCPEI